MPKNKSSALANNNAITAPTTTQLDSVGGSSTGISNIFNSLDTKQIIHIVSEIVVLIGLTFYFSSKNKKIQGHIEQLSQRLEEQEDKIQKLEAALQQAFVSFQQFQNVTGVLDNRLSSVEANVSNINELTLSMPPQKSNIKIHPRPQLKLQSQALKGTPNPPNSSQQNQVSLNTSKKLKLPEGSGKSKRKSILKQANNTPNNTPNNNCDDEVCEIPQGQGQGQAQQGQLFNKSKSGRVVDDSKNNFRQGGQQGQQSYPPTQPRQAHVNKQQSQQAQQSLESDEEEEQENPNADGDMDDTDPDLSDDEELDNELANELQELGENEDVAAQTLTNLKKQQ